MDNAEEAMGLIDQSQCHDEIRHANYSRGLAKELEVRSSGSIDTVGTVEFWGDDWRVHLERGEENIGKEEEFERPYNYLSEASEFLKEMSKL